MLGDLLFEKFGVQVAGLNPKFRKKRRGYKPGYKKNRSKEKLGNVRLVS